MTKLFSFLFAIMGIVFAATAQESKTMYVMKNGAITHKIAVSDVDSIVFYVPNATIRDIPENIGVQNMYKKAKQLELLPWIPLLDVPNLSTGYKAGTLVAGAPYSSTKEINTFIGYDVSIHTFMTAVKNKKSLLYTENIGNPPYNGVGCATYFGVVCNTFVGYAIGLNIHYDTYMYADLDFMIPLAVQDAQHLKLGDIMWQPGHVSIVTDIYRTNRGEIQQIHLSEAATYTPITTIYTPEQFNNRVQKKGGVIYRYKYLHENKYMPSKFVAVADEVITPYKYNTDICTFKGDMACFESNDSININFERGNYTKMEIYKNGISIDILDITTVEDINFSHQGYGLYKARLKNDKGDYSDYTYFEVVDVFVGYEKNGENVKVLFSSPNSEAIYVEFCTITGGPEVYFPLSDTDRQNGYVIVKPELTRYPQRYIKVHFSAEYGRVRNVPIQYLIAPYD